MSETKGYSFLLVGAPAETLSSVHVGNLTSEVSDEGTTDGFAVLDQFERPLLSSGRLLIETKQRLELICADETRAVTAGSARGKLVAALLEGSVRCAMTDLAPLRSLLPQGEGTLGRKVVTYRDANGKAQCKARLTLLRTKGGRLTIVRLIGVRGYDRALADVRAHMADAGAEPMSVARLFTHLFPDQATTLARPSVRLTPDRRVFDVACDLVVAQLPTMRATEFGIIDDLDTEFLHDYRVALRRIRSVISLFKGAFGPETTQTLKTQFATLMAATGPVRDLDVFLLEQKTTYGLLPQRLHKGLDAQFELIARRRESERKELVRHLRSDGYARQMDALSALFHDRAGLVRGSRAGEPILPYARTLIWKRYRRLCTHAEGIKRTTADAEVHLLRIDGKKLRYLMEFFAPLFPKEVLRRVIRPLKDLQDCLGVINDCAVQQESLQDLISEAARLSDRVSLEMAQSVGALTAILGQRQAAERTVALNRLADFTHPRVRRQFIDLFHAREKVAE